MKNINPKIIFSDFDGTLTDHTEFSRKFLDTLDLVSRHKIPFIIVTGRSVSWAHFFLTHFSDLAIVVSEGGGVTSFKNDKGLIENEYQIDVAHINHLKNFCEILSKTFPNIELSADSIGRISDRAIELCLVADEIERLQIMNFMKEHKINFSTSNVHLNFWSGEISKYKAVKNLMAKYYPSVTEDEVVYFGDSLNDQSMFKEIQQSIGVSNIKTVLGRMEHPPKIILEGEANAGPSGVLNYLNSLLS